MLRFKPRAVPMKCIAIRHLRFEDLGLFEEVLTAAGFQVSYFEAGLDSFETMEWEAAELLVILGGPIGVYETDDYPWLRTEIDIVAGRLRLDRPTLGICLGAQIMAAALGAAVYPGCEKEIGWSGLQVSPTANVFDLQSLAQTEILHWHGDTFDLPEGAVLLASTPKTPNQAFTYGKNALALQFHAEAHGERMEPWLIGHTLELRNAEIDIGQLRLAGLANAAEKALAGKKMLEQWLSHVGLGW